jgi:periplasmic divalent cation tolerance protein
MMLVLSTFPSRESAAKTASLLIEKRLAACVHISSGGESFYEWQGKLCHDREVQLWAKTENRLWEALRDEILDQHPFEVPQILGFNVDASLPAYESWVNEALKRETK